jgi:methionyl-tRNA formyltransferase
MDAGLDSGDIIAEEKFSLSGKETYKDLAEKLSQMGAEILTQTLKNLGDKNIVGIKQDSTLTTYAKKIDKAECEINWQDDAKEIERKIRALNGSLGAFFMYENEKIKIFAAEILDENSCEKKAGEILDEKFSIQCKRGVIRPLILQRQGKKAMSIEEFLRGFKQ